MNARTRTRSVSGERSVSSRPASSSHPHDSLVVWASRNEQGTPEARAPSSMTSTTLSAKEQQLLDDLASLFTVEEERCFSRASRGDSTSLSRTSLTSSQLADAAFIYQHVNHEALSRCVPNFVKSHLNKNGRYLPETFVLRVNYLRRRRALGEDSSAKKAVKEKKAKENVASKESVVTKENSAITGGSVRNAQSRLASAKASKTRGVSPKPKTLTEIRVNVISG